MSAVAENVSAEMPAPLLFTDSAAAKVADLIAEEGNPELKLNGSQQAVQISQRQALATPLSNPSPLGGREHVGVYTMFLADGNLFYFLTVNPEKDAEAFQSAFQKIASSLRLMDRR